MLNPMIHIAASSKPNGTNILIIYTGGTFGMVYDREGQLIPFNFNNVLERVPELHKLDLNIALVSFEQPVDSSDIQWEHWKSMGETIFKHYDQFDGFVVLHGTDTMAYSASALSFMLDGLKKPVIFTGAQIPIGATRSDARENLITALEIASQRSGGVSTVQEVCVYFNHVLIRGNRSQKVRSSNFGAFESENYPILAEAGVEITFHQAYLYRSSKESLSFYPEMDRGVALVKLFPEMHMDSLRAIVASGVKCLVMESFGSGNIMTNDAFLEVLQEAIDRGVTVLNVSQCVGGNVVHGKYATSSRLEQMGVVSGHDLTTEAALTKIMHLLANTADKKEMEKMLQIPLRGELSL